jgi:hypothetical protein
MQGGHTAVRDSGGMRMPVVALQARRAFSWLWIKSDAKAERLGRLRGFTVLPTGRT